MPKLLLDENLSPRVAIELRADGYDAVHIRERGRLGTSDAAVLELAAAREVHAGIVLLLDGGLRRDEQLEVLRRVIVALETAGDLVNRALTVALDGGFSLEEIPMPAV